MAALQLAACSSGAPAQAQKSTPVRAAAATTGPAMPVIATQGTVATKDEMHLSFKVGGVIKRITVEQGQAVRQGQQLAEIELTEIDAQVEQARATADKAARDLERGERLYADQVISLEQLQDLRTQAALQRSQLKSVQFNRGLSVISAPRDGVVLRKLVQEHELVPAGQPVLLLGAHNRGYVVRAALSDREIVQLKLGDAAVIRMDAYPGRSIPGSVAEIAGAADEKSGMFPVEVRFDAPSIAMASGLVAKLELHPASSTAGTLTYIPIAAMVEGDHDRASVFVVDGERVRRRLIQVAFIDPEEVAVAAGLHPGERVVTDGALYLEDGERVEILK